MSLQQRCIVLFILLLAAIGLSGCGLIQPEAQARCPPTPEGFSQEELVGTWLMATPTGRKDTLVIQEDGRFKQIVEVPVYDIEYESDWYKWWIEYSQTGIPYLHLEGMSLCAWGPDEVACEVPGAGEAWWFDGCKEESFQMPEGEVVLIVLGVFEQFSQPPRGFTLDMPGGHDRTWSYELVEP
jgi:hypothetical protein